MGYYEAPTLHVNYEFRENPAEWAKIPHLYHMKEDVELDSSDDRTFFRSADAGR